MQWEGGALGCPVWKNLTDWGFLQTGNYKTSQMCVNPCSPRLDSGLELS